jgi:hypothetical protein
MRNMPTGFYSLPLEEQQRIIEEAPRRAEREGILLSRLEPDPDEPGKLRKRYYSTVSKGLNKTRH